jgi:hypothetical protein
VKGDKLWLPGSRGTGWEWTGKGRGTGKRWIRLLREVQVWSEWESSQETKLARGLGSVTSRSSRWILFDIQCVVGEAVGRGGDAGEVGEEGAKNEKQSKKQDGVV